MLSAWEFREQFCQDTIDGNEIDRRYGKYFRENVQVGDGVTVHLWSDAKAYTVIKKTDKTLTMRRDKAIRDFTPEWVPGGFSAICTNNEDQKWKYEEDPDGEVIRAYWSDKWCAYYWQGCIVTPGRHEFYDYNF